MGGEFLEDVEVLPIICLRDQLVVDAEFRDLVIGHFKLVFDAILIYAFSIEGLVVVVVFIGGRCQAFEGECF